MAPEFDDACRDRLTPSRRYEAGAGGVRGMLTTILGEFARRTGEPTPSAALIDVLGRFGVEESTSRQALLRAAKDGWFHRIRDGRRTLWQLSEQFDGCSIGENTAQGYVADGGTRMWGPYGTGGLVVQSWTDPNSSAWKLFDQQVAKYGKPTAVWVQICVFTQGASYTEVKQLIANARARRRRRHDLHHRATAVRRRAHLPARRRQRPPTDRQPRPASRRRHPPERRLPGQFHLSNNEVVSDGCHANTTGQASLGRQALTFWG